MIKAVAVRRIFAWSLAMAAAAGGAGLVPADTAGAVLYRISPAVRALVRKLTLVDIPAAQRRRNWIGDRGQGSCVHAAIVHLFHWQGRHELAGWWGAHYGNGETADGLAAKLTSTGIPFAETRSGDEAFLEWAIRTRRGAAVVVQNGAHMVTLVGLDDRSAQILDSNSPEQIQTWTRERFLRDWQASGGWAVTPLGTPPAPEPWVVQGAARSAQKHEPGWPSRPDRAAGSRSDKIRHRAATKSHFMSLWKKIRRVGSFQVGNADGAESCRFATRPVPEARGRATLSF